jgi:methylated-DNA-[protein]-cysteine S-methyltransferase
MNVKPRSRRVVSSPVGPLSIGVAGDRLAEVAFDAKEERGPAHPLIRTAEAQLGEYFGGERTAFDLPLEIPGEGLLARVLSALLDVSYGETLSYGELTRRLGLEVTQAREVGAAIARNPIAIVIPCHRVIGADGSLTGFGGGLGRKRRLLDLESPQLQLA